MSVLPLSAIIAAGCLLSGCGGGLGDRSALSAKAWDTPFVVVRPIPAPRTDDGAKGRHAGRLTPNLAAYGQLPASLDPAYTGEELSAADPAADVPAEAASAASAPASAIVPSAVVVAAVAAPAPKLPAESTLDDTVTVDKISGAVASLDALHALRLPVEISGRAAVVEVRSVAVDD